MGRVALVYKCEDSSLRRNLNVKTSQKGAQPFGRLVSRGE